MQFYTKQINNIVYLHKYNFQTLYTTILYIMPIFIKHMKLFTFTVGHQVYKICIATYRIIILNLVNLKINYAVYTTRVPIPTRFSGMTVI